MAQVEATRIRPWLCHKCNLSSYLTMHRHRIDDVSLFSCGVVVIVVLNGRRHGHLMVIPYGLNNPIT